MSSRMPRRPTPAICLLILLMAGFALVHPTAGEAQTPTAKQKKTVEPLAGKSSNLGPAKRALPAGVIDMLDGIQTAIRSGRIEDLKTAIAWNELPPSFDVVKVDDPIAFWKAKSTDGEGREILAVLADIIDAGHAVLPIGRDVENSHLYIWPRFAEMALDKLSPEDEVQLYRLLKPADVKAMREKKKWTWYRLAIGADGTWLSFQKSD